MRTRPLMDTRLHIRTFGGLHIDGAPLPQKAAALLVYLARTRQRESREVLAELLWTDQPPERAASSLRVVLSQLRVALPDLLLTDRQTVEINPEYPLTLDASILDDIARDAEREWNAARTLSDVLLQQVEDAVGLYTGDFLFGFTAPNADAFEDWLGIERQALHTRAIQAVTYLVTEYERRAEPTKATHWAKRWVQLDDLNEEAHRALMRLLASAGERSAALEQFEVCRRTLRDQLEIEPASETLRLRDRIRTGEFAPSAKTAPPHNLTRQPTPFIGRDAELLKIRELLADPACQLLTILGAGGMGKTRLALRAAEEQIGQFTHGVYVVSLTALDDARLLPQLISEALKLPFPGSADLFDQLTFYLSDKHMLLVLDNFEHLLDGALLLARILEAAPGVKLLVTSQERLNLREEWLFPLEGMPYPAASLDLSVADLETYPATRLLVQHIRRINPAFAASENIQAIVRLCRLVEGMPLALELAATWTRVSSLDEIAAQVATNFELLSSPARNIPERQRSILATFERAWQTLTPDEQNVFMRLSVFRDAFDLEAAQAVAGASVPTLLQLVEKSLIRRSDTRQFDYHELVRRYAETKLNDSAESEQTRHLHLFHILDLVLACVKKLSSSERVEGMRRLIDILDDVRAALEWSLTCADNPDYALRLATAMFGFWQARGDFTEAGQWLERAIRQRGVENHPESLVKALHAQTGNLWWVGRYDEALASLTRSQDILRQLDRHPGANSLRGMGILQLARGDWQAAQTALEQSIPLLRETNDAWNLLIAVIGLAQIAPNDSLAALELAALASWTPDAPPIGNLYTALNERALPEQVYLFGVGNAVSAVKWDAGKRVMAQAFLKLGRVALERGLLERAEAFHKDALTLYCLSDEHYSIGACLAGMADFAENESFAAALRTAARELQDGLQNFRKRGIVEVINRALVTKIAPRQ